MNKTKFKQTETCGERSPEQGEGRSRTIGEIPEGWNVQAIADLPIDIIDGDRGVNYPKKNEFEKQGFCLFLSTKNVPGEHFDFSECDFISRERDQILRKGKLQKEDIVLTTRGTVGNIAYYHERIPYEHIRINSGMVIIRNAGDKFDTKYLYHLLKSPIVKQQYLSFATGSAQPQLPIRDINKIRLTLPSILEQRAIAKILSDLDEKIELNHQMNKTLEAIGQAIFKRWFVDFEFPDKNGKPYKTPGGKLVDSELGEIPDGWAVDKVSKLVRILSGFAFKSSDFVNDSLYRLVTIKNVQDGYFEGETKDGLSTIPNKMPEYCKLQSGDILLSLTGNVGRVCLVVGENYLLNQRVAKLSPVNKIDYGFVYLLFRQNKTLAMLENLSAGTAQQNLSPIKTAEINIIIPSRSIMEQFGKTVNPMLKMILDNLKQNIFLSQIRDSLLPRLMNGKIRVNICEKEN